MGTKASKSVVLSSVEADDDEFDETNLVSKKPTKSNVSNDEFDLDDEDSRQLSIDQSFPDSRQSESESIPYDNHEHQVRAAMEELIDEEILSNKVVRVVDESHASAIEDLNVQAKQEVSKPTKVPLEKSRSKDSSPSDVEEDFELISADDL